jgi:hypothetical protein
MKVFFSGLGSHIAIRNYVSLLFLIWNSFSDFLMFCDLDISEEHRHFTLHHVSGFGLVWGSSGWGVAQTELCSASRGRHDIHIRKQTMWSCPMAETFASVPGLWWYPPGFCALNYFFSFFCICQVICGKILWASCYLTTATIRHLFSQPSFTFCAIRLCPKHLFSLVALAKPFPLNGGGENPRPARSRTWPGIFWGL